MTENAQNQPKLRQMAMKTGWGDLDPDVVRDTLREDVVAVVKEVLSDKETMKIFWSSAIEAFQERSVNTAGRYALGAVGSVLKRGVLWAAIGLGIYYVGGLGALVAFVKSQLGGH